MALEKRLDYGFRGYQLPPIPRAARSIRRRGILKRKADGQPMCAFDLLATVAGKLLLDGENQNGLPPGEQQEQPLFLKEESTITLCEKNFLSEEDPPINDSFSLQEQLLPNDDCKLQLGFFTPVVVDQDKVVKIESANNRNFSLSDDKPSPYSSGHVQDSAGKSSPLVCSVNNPKSKFSEDHAPPASSLLHWDTVNLVNNSRHDDDDDDDNFSIRNKAIKPPQRRFGDRSLPSKHRRMNSNGESNSCPSKDSSGFKWQRSLRDYPLKKRKIYECGGLVPTSDESIGTHPTYQVPANGTNGDGHGSASNQPGASVPGGYVSFHPRSSQVKLKIKSFRVPELVIEIPETATVGSLKRRVMEAVNSVLGGGLRVGVLVQGKKIGDDDKTLAQTGISLDNKMDMLGFSLEPSSNPAPIRLYPEYQVGQMLCQSPQPLRRYPPAHRPAQRNFDHGNKLMGSDHKVVGPCASMLSLQRTSSESKALVPLTTKHDALAVVPLRKSKHSECAQRRIRRPFTVAEVEALVQAVEKLGTGRWRDVKLRAFDNAKHRTYVDLKDKWKTLVHTARISPQQRRGEPVPQELLDRVLTAHAYWSQQQAKQQLKYHQPHTCLLL